MAWAVRSFGGKRSTRYQQLNKYLTGDHPLEFATGRFKSAFGQTFKAFSYNRCAQVVDSHADRLQVAGFECGDDEGLQTLVEQIWADNLMDVQEGQIEREQFALGDAYVIVEKDPDTGDILIWPQQADAVRVQYSQERPGTVIRAAKRWTDDAGRKRLTLYFPDRIEKYAGGKTVGVETTDGVHPMVTDGGYQPVQDDGDEAWPLELGVDDTVPVFHFANNAPIGRYGISELHDVIPLQDALNKTCMDMIVAMEFGAYPQRYFIDVINTITNPITGEETVDPELARFQAGMTRILSLFSATDEDGNAKGQVGEFSATDIAQYHAAIEGFDVRISRVSRVPVHELQMTDAPESGIARRLKEGPFVKKMDDRVRSAGPIWAAVMRYAARLDGREVAPRQIRTQWEPTAPLTEEEKLLLALDRKTLGFPLEENLRRMGEAEDTITLIVAAKAAEQEAAMAANDRAFDRGLLPIAGSR